MRTFHLHCFVLLRMWWLCLVALQSGHRSRKVSYYLHFIKAIFIVLWMHLKLMRADTLRGSSSINFMNKFIRLFVQLRMEWVFWLFFSLQYFLRLSQKCNGEWHTLSISEKKKFLFWKKTTVTYIKNSTQFELNRSQWL